MKAEQLGYLPEATENCIHGVPKEMDCVHCLLAYCDFAMDKIWSYARFLEQFLETLLGENWKHMTLDDIRKMPNLPLRISCTTE